MNDSYGGVGYGPEERYGIIDNCSMAADTGVVDVPDFVYESLMIQ